MGLHDAGLKDPQQRQHWIDGDGVERKRIIDFEAFRMLKQNQLASTSGIF
jgi:hypothetical protein